MADNTDLIRWLAYGLDACLEHLDAEAEREKRKEAGKAIRSVTAQKRAKMSRKVVEEAFELLGVER